MRWAFVGIIVLGNTCGDVLATMGMKRNGEVDDLRPRHMLHLAWHILRNPHVMAGMGCLAVTFFALLGLLSIANVSFAVPATSLGYLLEILLAKYVLKEEVHWRRWAGAALVAGGVLMISL